MPLSLMPSAKGGTHRRRAYRASVLIKVREGEFGIGDDVISVELLVRSRLVDGESPGFGIVCARSVEGARAPLVKGIDGSPQALLEGGNVERIGEEREIGFGREVDRLVFRLRLGGARQYGEEVYRPAEGIVLVEDFLRGGIGVEERVRAFGLIGPAEARALDVRE